MFCVLKHRTPACVVGVECSNCRRLLFCKTFYMNNKNDNAFGHDQVKKNSTLHTCMPTRQQFSNWVTWYYDFLSLWSNNRKIKVIVEWRQYIPSIVTVCVHHSILILNYKIYISTIMLIIVLLQIRKQYVRYVIITPAM